MKVLVFIDHDIICRHFIMSDALRPLVDVADIRFVFPDDDGRRVTLDPDSLTLGAPYDRVPIDARRQQMWRWMLYADQLKLRPGTQVAAIRRIRWQTLGWKAALLLTIAGLPGIEWIFRRVIERRMRDTPNKALSHLLDRTQPDLVLHPTVLDGVFCNDLIFECKARGVPVVFAINSWDNPSTKRAVVGKPDRLLVWGPQTREHAVKFMALDPDRVVPFGVAQFDVYRGAPRIDRVGFSAANGIDPNKRIILFAGSNARTDEFSLLTALDDAIESGNLPGISLLYRPHPWGLGGRGGERLASANWRHVKVHAPMRSYIEQLAAGNRKAMLPDYRDTHDLLSAVDVVVSPLSTILVEAALHQKPVVVFAPTDYEKSQEFSKMLPMLHFQQFLALDEVTTATSAAELVRDLRYLSNPQVGSERGEALSKACVEFIAPFSAPWRDRVVEYLYSVAGKSPPLVKSA